MCATMEVQLQLISKREKIRQPRLKKAIALNMEPPQQRGKCTYLLTLYLVTIKGNTHSHLSQIIFLFLTDIHLKVNLNFNTDLV